VTFGTWINANKCGRFHIDFRFHSYKIIFAEEKEEVSTCTAAFALPSRAINLLLKKKVPKYVP